MYASEHGAPVAVLVGDDDSCTIKKVRESVSHNVIKWSDTVHAKRSFATSLYAIQKNHKGTLSGKVINYLLTCFVYALSQNKGNVQGLQKNLRAIAAHTFSKHDNYRTASASWCGFLQDPNTHTNIRHSHMARICKMKTCRKTFPLWLKSLSRMLTNWPH